MGAANADVYAASANGQDVGSDRAGARDEPVQTTQKVTQVVMRPLPPTAAANNMASTLPGSLPPGAITTNAYAYNQSRAYQRPVYPAPATAQPAAWTAPAQASYAYGRSNNQPLVASVPLLGRQPSQSIQPGSLLKAPINGLRDIVRATTATFNGQASYSSYAQP